MFNQHILEQIQDTLQLQAKASNPQPMPVKKGLSNPQKWAIGLGTIGLMGTIAFLVAKGKFSKAKKLAEHIEFKPAQTIDEAIEFGKQALGVKKYQGFEAKDVDVLNWANEGFVNVSNKLKGNVRMPKCVSYTTEMSENTLAGVIRDSGGKFDGWFGINKKIFNNLDDSINKQLDNLKSIISMESKNGTIEGNVNACVADDKLLLDVIGFKANKLKSFREKVHLQTDLMNVADAVYQIAKTPVNGIRRMLKTSGTSTILSKDKSLLMDIDQIKKINIDDQGKLLRRYTDTIIKEGLTPRFYIREDNLFNTIYHEMGHLQDMTPRVAVATKFNYNPEQYPKALTEWINNNSSQEIAQQVSDYSTSGPGEFIAEAFAKQIQGTKLSDGALALYKQMNGPSVG